MSTTNDGGPAFPIPGMQNEGMSTRDYFAAAFVQGLLATDSNVDIAGDMPGQNIAAWAYALADAMLAERRKVRP